MNAVKMKGYCGYVGYDHNRREAIVIGDRVVAKDEWGYWQADVERHTGTIGAHHGWQTMLVRADGTRFIADGHTTRLELA